MISREYVSTEMEVRLGGGSELEVEEEVAELEAWRSVTTRLVGRASGGRSSRIKSLWSDAYPSNSQI